MQVFFKMIIDDGEKYYAGEDPGVAICDYVYMRGLNGIDDNNFWENQRKHYREHMQFNFGFIPNLRSTLIDVAEEIAKRIELDPQKFIEFRVPIYILENLEFVEIADPTIPLSTISKYYDISKALHIFFVLSNQAGDIWVEDGLRYYMHSKEAGRHNLPHIHVDYKHECSATISLYDGKMVDGDMPRRVMKRASKKIMDNQRYLMECWNKLTDGLRIDLNVYFGATPLKPGFEAMRVCCTAQISFGRTFQNIQNGVACQKSSKSSDFEDFCFS